MNELLKPTSDRKTRFYNSQQNTFGLLPGLTDGGTCPGCTTTAGGCWCVKPGRKTHGCYVDNIMRVYPGVKNVLQNNTDLLRDNSESVAAMTTILDDEFTRFEIAEKKRSVRINNCVPIHYRLHWAGDIFNEKYAQALRNAILKHPNVQFWGYTRSFFAVPILTDISNLILYLSLDPVNILTGLVVYDLNGGPTNPRLQLCYMNPTNDFDTIKPQYDTLVDTLNKARITKGRKLLSSSWLKNLTLQSCPVDTGKLKLENGCPTCKRCLTPGTAPIWFKS